MNRKKSYIKDSLDKLSEKDVYSLLLHLLFMLREDEKYSTLSYLIWTLDKESLLNFLRVFEDVELKVPKLSDLKLLTSALVLYQETELDNVSLDDALSTMIIDEYSKKDLLEAYYKIKDIMGSTRNV